MYDNTDFTHWVALASVLVAADRKPEHNFQRCFYAQCSVPETQPLQTPLSVRLKGRLRISYKAGIAICWASREWALSAIYYYISLTKFGNGFEQWTRCHCQPARGTEVCAYFPSSRWKRRGKTVEEEMSLRDPWCWSMDFKIDGKIVSFSPENYTWIFILLSDKKRK